VIARARATGVLALGVLALHELAYLLAGSQPAGAHASHAYLTEALPVVVMLATALLAVSLLAPLGGATLEQGSLGAGSRTLLYAGLLLGAFGVQELAEAALDPVPGHALGALAAGATLAAVPVALALGVAAALVTRGLEDVEELLAVAQLGTAPRSRRMRPESSRPGGFEPRRVAAGASLAFGFARRPPPAALPA
jgi:hypothetical protein